MIASLRLIPLNLKISKVPFIADMQSGPLSGQADLDPSDVQRRPSIPSSHPHSAVHSNTWRLPSQPRRPVAQQQRSNIRAGSELTGKGGVIITLDE